MLKWLRKLWHSLTALLWHRQRLKAVWVSDIPDRLRVDHIYIAGENGYLWYIAMLCPCGCQEVLYMSLMPEGRPRWHIQQNADNTISLRPSVHRKIGCKSHFFLKSSRIEWCKPHVLRDSHET